jgi:hypothetical protein
MKVCSRVAAVVASVVLAGGCASVTVSPVKNGYGSAGAAYQRGVRFYRPALHIWILPADPSEKVDTVTTSKTETLTRKSAEGIDAKDPKRSSDEKVVQSTGTQVASTGKGWKTQLVMLPDYSQEYVIDWSPGIGSVTAGFTLADGWNLTALSSSADSKASESASAGLGAIATVAAAAAGALTSDTNWKGPGLYRLAPQADGTLKLGTRVLPLE